MADQEKPRKTWDDLNDAVWFYARDRRVLDVIARVDRKKFVSSRFRDIAYEDFAITFHEGVSISQPSLVAEMVEHLRLSGNEKVLEIGAGSGYQAAILANLAREVVTVDIDEKVVRGARKKLQAFGYSNIKVLVGDGCLGVPNEAPFNAIIVSAAVREIPNPLIEQLAEGGRIVIPVGRDPQDAYLVVGFKRQDKLHSARLKGVHFYPLKSSEQGGWTDEDLAELLDNKVKFLEEILKELEEEQPGKAEELLRSEAKKFEIEPFEREKVIRAVASLLKLRETEVGS